jgi:hypothetical protein
MQMARVIVTALYDMKELAPAEHPEVVIRARKGTVALLEKQHAMALKAIESKTTKEG